MKPNMIIKLDFNQLVGPRSCLVFRTFKIPENWQVQIYTSVTFIIFLQIQAEVGLRRLVLAGTECFVFWLSGPHGTSNFDHQSLIRSDLNYTKSSI